MTKYDRLLKVIEELESRINKANVYSLCQNLYTRLSAMERAGASNEAIGAAFREEKRILIEQLVLIRQEFDS